MGITSAQKTTVLEIIQEMTYAPSDMVYQAKYDQLNELGLPKVMDYFNTNWHGIHSE